MIIHNGPLYDVLINTPDFFETDQSENYKRILEKLSWHFNLLSKREEIIIQSLILELIYTIGKDTTKRTMNHKSITNHCIIENALDFITNNLKEDLSLEKIAKQMSLSPVYFHTLFMSRLRAWNCSRIQGWTCKCGSWWIEDFMGLGFHKRCYLWIRSRNSSFWYGTRKRKICRRCN